MSEDTHRELFKNVLSIKAESWRYEDEWRVVVELKKCILRDGMYFLPIPDDFITGVFLGAECPVDIKYMRRLLNQVNLSDVEVTKTSLSAGEFRIDGPVIN